MVEVFVGQNNLFHSPLAHTGGEGHNLIENIIVGADVNQRVYVIDSVPVTANVIYIAGIFGRILF
jgi:hypothetical protein